MGYNDKWKKYLDQKKDFAEQHGYGNDTAEKFEEGFSQSDEPTQDEDQDKKKDRFSSLKKLFGQ